MESEVSEVEEENSKAIVESKSVESKEEPKPVVSNTLEIVNALCTLPNGSIYLQALTPEITTELLTAPNFRLGLLSLPKDVKELTALLNKILDIRGVEYGPTLYDQRHTHELQLALLAVSDRSVELRRELCNMRPMSDEVLLELMKKGMFYSPAGFRGIISPSIGLQIVQECPWAIGDIIPSDVTPAMFLSLFPIDEKTNEYMEPKLPYAIWSRVYEKCKRVQDTLFVKKAVHAAKMRRMVFETKMLELSGLMPAILAKVPFLGRLQAAGGRFTLFGSFLRFIIKRFLSNPSKEFEMDMTQMLKFLSIHDIDIKVSSADSVQVMDQVIKLYEEFNQTNKQELPIFMVHIKTSDYVPRHLRKGRNVSSSLKPGHYRIWIPRLNNKGVFGKELEACWTKVDLIVDDSLSKLDEFGVNMATYNTNDGAIKDASEMLESGHITPGFVLSEGFLNCRGKTMIRKLLWRTLKLLTAGYKLREIDRTMYANMFALATNCEAPTVIKWSGEMQIPSAVDAVELIENATVPTFVVKSASKEEESIGFDSFTENGAYLYPFYQWATGKISFKEMQEKL